MDDNKKHVAFGGRLVIVGFGSIGQGVLPLVLRHIAMPRENIAIVTAEGRGREVADRRPAARKVQIIWGGMRHGGLLQHHF